VVARLLPVQDTVSIILFNVLPQLIDILVACTYLASALKGPWVALIVLFTVGSYVPLTLLITEQRGKVRAASKCLHCASFAEQYWLQLSVHA
jgi:ATP-binding cassette subfamily B (MDR/TAP) protein 6